MAGGQSKFVTERPTRGSGISAKRKDSRQVQLSFLHLLKILVALHLFSEREKDKLAQLVDTMFFYCITYTISKIEPPERMQGYGASPDAPPLSLDPQSTTLLTLRTIKLNILGSLLAMKRVLLHVVRYGNFST
ncbi:uncharacterized protein [Typha angustifolia]|uniref:uncharacterized protein isoform X2 n=1 Tax=Typha angustifolia TaxID=59011 RepID=UPI003C2C13FB